jgi:hypothetical protein
MSGCWRDPQDFRALFVTVRLRNERRPADPSVRRQTPACNGNFRGYISGMAGHFHIPRFLLQAGSLLNLS